MKKLTVISLIMTMFLIMVGCSSSTPKDRFELTEEEWIKDIDYLSKTIKKEHANPFETISEEEWDKQVETLKKDVPSLTPVAISLRMNQLVANLREENTVIDYSTLVGQSREEMIVYPFTLDWIENKLVVLQGNEKAKDVVGKALVAVNGQSIDSVIEKINTLIPYENEKWTDINSRVLVTFPEVLKFFGITKEDRVTFTFEAEGESKVELSLEPMKYEEIKFEEDLSENYRKNFTQTMPKDAIGAYWYNYNPEDKLFYFQYNQGIFKDDIKGNNEIELPKIKEFKEELIESINKEEIKTFVVDLRREMSGNSKRMEEIVKALKEETKVLTDSKIYVLIGTNTFGPGVQDALTWKNEGNAVLVGEDTGGNAVNSLRASGYRLPNSQIVLQLPTEVVKNSEVKGRLTPDVVASQTITDYVKGIDTVFEVVKAK